MTGILGLLLAWGKVGDCSPACPQTWGKAPEPPRWAKLEVGGPGQEAQDAAPEVHGGPGLAQCPARPQRGVVRPLQACHSGSRDPGPRLWALGSGKRAALGPGTMCPTGVHLSQDTNDAH